MTNLEVLLDTFDHHVGEVDLRNKVIFSFMFEFSLILK